MRKIHRQNLPSKMPIIQTLTVFLAMDYWNAPEWVFGIVCFSAAIIWGVAIHAIVTEKKEDVFTK
jgi:uncharacterized membrane protein